MPSSTTHGGSSKADDSGGKPGAADDTSSAEAPVEAAEAPAAATVASAASAASNRTVTVKSEKPYHPGPSIDNDKKETGEGRGRGQHAMEGSAGTNKLSGNGSSTSPFLFIDSDDSDTETDADANRDDAQEAGGSSQQDEAGAGGGPVPDSCGSDGTSNANATAEVPDTQEVDMQPNDAEIENGIVTTDEINAATAAAAAHPAASAATAAAPEGSATAREDPRQELREPLGVPDTVIIKNLPPVHQPTTLSVALARARETGSASTGQGRPASTRENPPSRLDDPQPSGSSHDGAGRRPTRASSDAGAVAAVASNATKAKTSEAPDVDAQNRPNLGHETRDAPPHGAAPPRGRAGGHPPAAALAPDRDVQPMEVVSGSPPHGGLAGLLRKAGSGAAALAAVASASSTHASGAAARPVLGASSPPAGSSPVRRMTMKSRNDVDANPAALAAGPSAARASQLPSRPQMGNRKSQPGQGKPPPSKPTPSQPAPTKPPPNQPALSNSAPSQTPSSNAARSNLAAAPPAATARETTTLVVKRPVKSRNNVSAAALPAANSRKRKVPPSDPAGGGVRRFEDPLARSVDKGTLKKPPPQPATALAQNRPRQQAAPSMKPPPPAAESHNSRPKARRRLREAPVALLENSSQVKELQVGDRVYAKWEENSQWYFGAVLRREVKYVIQFDDGDISRRGLDRNDVYAVDEVDLSKSDDRKQAGRKRRVGRPGSADSQLNLFIENGETSLNCRRLPGSSAAVSQQHASIEEARASGPASYCADSVEAELRPGKRDTAGLVRGAKVYALCPTTGRWYWAKVVSVIGKGVERKVEVSFAEISQFAALTANDVYTEDEYLSLCPLSLEELTKMACMECSLCRRVDCGRCKSCRANEAAEPRSEKKVCLFKMCLQIPNEMKAQHLPGYTPTARFVVTEPGRLPASIRAKAPLHPDLAGLLVLTARKNFRGIETHFRSRRGASADEIVADIYHDLFGIDKDEEVQDHELLRKRWLREWIDGSLARRSLSGIVTACYKPFGSNSAALRSVKVDFDEVSVVNLNRTLAFFDLEVPKSEIMKVHDAWSGCMEAGFHPRSGLPDDMDLQLRWVVPDSITDSMNGSFPCRTVKAMGHVFLVQVKSSTIDEAGLGAFMTVQRPSGPMHPHGSCFRLQRGVQIDFGVYAPLKYGNWKLHAVAIVKDFVTGGKCDVYSWECAKRDGVFDITNDRTGELLEEARRSVLTYVNEGNHPRIDAPSMEVQSDPSGAIHYLLGHMDPQRDDLVFEYGKEVELRVDYGEKYEKIRVRNGYPRVSGEILAELEREIASERAEMLPEMMHWEASDVEQSIQFFFSACCPRGGAADDDDDDDDEPDPSLLPAEYRERLFAAVLVLHVRMKDLIASRSSSPASPGGEGRSRQVESVARSRRLLNAMLRPPRSLFLEAMLANDLSRQAIRLAFGDIDEASLSAMSHLDVSWRLANLL